MASTGTYLSLVRWPNLLIIVGVQVVVQYWIVARALAADGLEPKLTVFAFAALVLGNVLIAASGYVINDIFDMEIDAVNKPGRRLIPDKISRTAAVRYCVLLMVGGVIAVIASGLLIGNLWIPVLMILAAIALWWYSWKLKRWPFIGNLAVSAFCAGAVFILWVPEYHHELSLTGPSFTAILLAYVFFAFFSTMYREMIKDLEDVEGDARHGARTLPIVLGNGPAKVLAAINGLIMAGGLSWWLGSISPPPTGISWYFPLLAIILPSIISLGLLWSARTKTDFSKLSKLVKLIMVAGILYILLI